MFENLSNLLQILHQERQVCCSYEGSQQHGEEDAELDSDSFVCGFVISFRDYVQGSGDGRGVLES